MHNIIPLAQVSRQTLRDLAKAAVANGHTLLDSNPFEAGSANHSHFEQDFNEYDRELAAVD